MNASTYEGLFRRFKKVPDIGQVRFSYLKKRVSIAIVYLLNFEFIQVPWITECSFKNWSLYLYECVYTNSKIKKFLNLSSILIKKLKNKWGNSTMEFSLVLHFLETGDRSSTKSDAYWCHLKRSMEEWMISFRVSRWDKKKIVQKSRVGLATEKIG